MKSLRNIGLAVISAMAMSSHSLSGTTPDTPIGTHRSAPSKAKPKVITGGDSFFKRKPKVTAGDLEKLQAAEAKRMRKNAKRLSDAQGVKSL